jgi:hypothetical protein
MRGELITAGDHDLVMTSETTLLPNSGQNDLNQAADEITSWSMRESIVAAPDNAGAQ